jgi:hypothetical protein
MSSCFKTGDNKYADCPARMADGRHFTDYRPSCHINDLIRADNSISNSFQYRRFLQENADSLMNRNRQIACERNCCGPCPASGAERFNDCTMLPEQFMFVTDGRMGKMVMNNPNGVGVGRKYWTFQNSPDECKNLPSAWPTNMKQNNCVAPMDAFAYLGAANPIPSPLRQAQVAGGELLSGSDKRVFI